MNIAGVIPARYGSSRFPGKPLALVHGRAMIVRVCEQAAKSTMLGRVWVATDHERIAEAVREAGFEARMTPSDCASGSDRIAASLAPGEAWDVLVNIQGDEPFIEPAVIDAATRALVGAPDCAVGTVVTPIRDRSQFESPHVVKAVLRQDGRALYFSRSPLPSPARLTPEAAATPDFVWGLKHLGLYAWRAEALLAFSGWPQTPLERRESLEQLRLLERGLGIVAVVSEHDSIGVDTPEELEMLNLRPLTSSAA
jgi:3-deoxy-manno-octulosonate cytidylyltransferase (CMP-KDO synthetase)